MQVHLCYTKPFVWSQLFYAVSVWIRKFYYLIVNIEKVQKEPQSC